MPVGFVGGFGFLGEGPGRRVGIDDAREVGAGDGEAADRFERDTRGSGRAFSGEFQRYGIMC